MEAVLIQLAIAAAQAIPHVLAAIRDSTTLTEAEKAAKLDAIEVELERAKVAVQAVRFRDV